MKQGAVIHLLACRHQYADRLFSSFCRWTPFRGANIGRAVPELPCRYSRTLPESVRCLASPIPRKLRHNDDPSPLKEYEDLVNMKAHDARHSPCPLDYRDAKTEMQYLSKHL